MAGQLTSVQIIIALAAGILPSIIWLIFWLKTDKERPEPLGLLTACFLSGAICVLLATLLQQMTASWTSNQLHRIVLWAGIEEILKCVAFFIIAKNSDYDDEAIDPAIYLIAVALGFAALENAFYLLSPATSFNVTASLLTGSLRFFGSTLLHTIASAFIGICIGLSSKRRIVSATLFGLIGAIFLHSTFNFFILKNNTASFLQVYGYLWVVAIISHLILEKLRRLPTIKTLPTA